MSSASPLRTVVLVSGSGSNLQAIIDHTQSGSLGIQLTGVISDRPGVLALERARRASIPALTIDHAQAGSSAAFQQQLGTALAELDPQLVVLADDTQPGGEQRILEALRLLRRHVAGQHPIGHAGCGLAHAGPGRDAPRRAI